MRPEEKRQGGVALGLSEYTSRYCRLKLVEACVEGIERELNEKHDRGVSQLGPRVGPARVLARILGVSTRTVQRWISGGVQSCNVNCEALITAALRYAPEEALRLLEEDLLKHEEEFRSLVIHALEEGD